MSQIAEKKRTTVYMSQDVLEFLKIRSAKGNGSVSQQLENLARELMPSVSNANISEMEKRHREGYEKFPADEDNFDELYESQSLDNL